MSVNLSSNCMKTPEVGKITMVRERGRNIRVSITLQKLQILYAGDTTTKTEKDCIQRKAGKTVACAWSQPAREYCQ